MIKKISFGIFEIRLIENSSCEYRVLFFYLHCVSSICNGICQSFPFTSVKSVWFLHHSVQFSRFSLIPVQSSSVALETRSHVRRLNIFLTLWGPLNLVCFK